MIFSIILEDTQYCVDRIVMENMNNKRGIRRKKKRCVHVIKMKHQAKKVLNSLHGALLASCCFYGIFLHFSPNDHLFFFYFFAFLTTRRSMNKCTLSLKWSSTLQFCLETPIHSKKNSDKNFFSNHKLHTRKATQKNRTQQLMKKKRKYSTK